MNRAEALPKSNVAYPPACVPPDSLHSPPAEEETQHPPGEIGDAVVSYTTLAAPKAARSAYEKARRSLASKTPGLLAAARELEKAVALYGRFAAAWHLLGRTRIALRQNEAARQAFQRALAADSKYPAPYVPLALMELEAGRFAEADQLCDQVFKLHPGLIEAHYYHAVAHYSLGDHAGAQASIRAIIDSGQDRAYPAVHVMLGEMFVAKGDLQAAAVEYRRLLDLRPAGRVAEAARRQLADWEKQGLVQCTLVDDCNSATGAPVLSKDTSTLPR